MRVVHAPSVTFGLRLTDSTGSDESWAADSIGLEVHYGTHQANGYCEVLLDRSAALQLADALTSLSKALGVPSPVSGDSRPRSPASTPNPATPSR